MERQRNNRRDQRAREAERHIADMEARFGREVAASVAGIKVYSGIPQKKAAVCEAASQDVPAPEEDVSVPEADIAVPEADAAVPEAGDAQEEASDKDESPVSSLDALPSVVVVDQDSVAAVLEHGRGRAQFCDLALLDFASFTSPGGGYNRGAWAQEEALCSESYLYNVLSTQKAWYGENRRRNINCNLYRNRGLVVPAVRFTRGKIHAFADVIVVAAPNARFARQEYGVKEELLVQAMHERIRMVLGVADELGHEKLVLGAFGCGAFGWDAEQVAEMFRAELADGAHVAKQVIFAIPQSRFDENLAKFEHVLKDFPQPPEESYEAAAARAAAASVSTVQSDEEDDDWHKYL